MDDPFITVISFVLYLVVLFFLSLVPALAIIMIFFPVRNPIRRKINQLIRKEMNKYTPESLSREISIIQARVRRLSKKSPETTKTPEEDS